MKYLALQNTETKKEWLSVLDFEIQAKRGSDFQIITEDTFEGEEEEILNISEVSLEVDSFIFIEESNGNKEMFRVVEFETSKSEDIVKELKDFSINAKKANSTDTIYIELDSEIEGFEAIRISDHKRNGSERNNNKIEIDINKITDIVDFCQELEQMISWQDLSLIENWIYEN